MRQLKLNYLVDRILSRKFEEPENHVSHREKEKANNWNFWHKVDFLASTESNNMGQYEEIENAGISRCKNRFCTCSANLGSRDDKID